MGVRRIVLVAFAWAVLPSMAMALPLSVRVISAQYTTEVTARTAPLVTSRTTTSTSPVDDTLILDGWDEIRGIAGPFSVYARTVFSFAQPDPILATHAGASATSVLGFTPLSDATAALEFAFEGYSQARWSGGFVRLEDVTTAELLWDYGWTCCTLSGPIWGDRSDDYYATAALTVDQLLNSSHAYVLTMHTVVTSDADREGMAIHVSGLDAVPEPSWLPLVATGVLVVAGVLTRSRLGFAWPSF